MGFTGLIHSPGLHRKIRYICYPNTLSARPTNHLSIAFTRLENEAPIRSPIPGTEAVFAYSRYYTQIHGAKVFLRKENDVSAGVIFKTVNVGSGRGFFLAGSSITFEDS
jgi:hypothetical protein